MHGWVPESSVCVSLPPPSFPFILLFLFQYVHMLLKCCPLSLGSIGVSFLCFFPFFFLFLSFLYQLNRLNKLDRNCTEIICGRELPNQIATDNNKMTVLVSLFFGRSGLVCLELHIHTIGWFGSFCGIAINNP